MPDSNRLPRSLIITELIGVFFILMALVLLNSNFAFGTGTENHFLAKASLFCGVILILPAVCVLIWRTVVAMLVRDTAQKK
ncbi:MULTISPECIES: DUF1418 family protein [Tatumella]|uniref:DUF1418 family protein n=1 Tax=Tatumella punctata TaxID=399969 RepID=A0ABW1VNK9_9GAMM|nr:MULTISPECIES: DUF1418 family protein [unclassified Tatumella]MBS0854688.1 DUF1418 family protein [Tatumella sp. JGM16]MBS0892530.1 DUF1418 family protein [Tatumella sp. JGM130]MBS0911392.1 DUF1418 family protein [Tatumella sp. JGM91]